MAFTGCPFQKISILYMILKISDLRLWPNIPGTNELDNSWKLKYIRSLSSTVQKYKKITILHSHLYFCFVFHPRLWLALTSSLDCSTLTKGSRGSWGSYQLSSWIAWWWVASSGERCNYNWGRPLDRDGFQLGTEKHWRGNSFSLY